jgi:D-alanyl-D-alanine carboxypeptidase
MALLGAPGVASGFQAALDADPERFGFPGATAAYVLSDGTIGVAATGMADLKAGIPMTVHSRILPASIGKIFVSSTALALDREGALELDAPVSDWLGDRHWSDPDNPFPPEALVEFFLDRPPLFRPDRRGPTQTPATSSWD